MTPNERAFLSVIAWILKADYNSLADGSVFETFDDHPRQYLYIGKQIPSSGAGRYQLMVRDYDLNMKSAGIENFGPQSQDKLALHLIDKRGGIIHINTGNIEEAVARARYYWPQLPDAKEWIKMSDIRTVFIENGGSL